MSTTAPAAATVAARAGAALADRTLARGRPFYAARDGVAVVVAPVAAADGDHELTVSTGFPPDPAAIAGIAVWIERPGPGGWVRAMLGETDRLGSLRFAPGVAEYRLTTSAPAALPFPADRLAGLFQRDVLLAGGGPRWRSVGAGPVTLGSSPFDSGLLFSFPAAPHAAAYAWAQDRDGRIVHEVFPLRPAAGGEWKGYLHLPKNAAWEELRVEPLSAAVLARLDAGNRRLVLEKLAERLRETGDERPRRGEPERYRDLWEPLLGWGVAET